jgi:hypothetical protein
LPVFQKLRERRQDRHVFLYAFDLIELDRKDLRRDPLVQRKELLRQAGLQMNDPLAERLCAWLRGHRLQAAQPALSLRPLTRLGPAAPAVKREAEEDWGRRLPRT